MFELKILLGCMLIADLYIFSLFCRWILFNKEGKAEFCNLVSGQVGKPCEKLDFVLYFIVFGFLFFIMGFLICPCIALIKLGFWSDFDK